MQIVRDVVPVIAPLALLTSTPAELFALPDGGPRGEWHLGKAEVESEFDVDRDVVVLVRDQSGDRRVDGFDLMQNRSRALLSSTDDANDSSPAMTSRAARRHPEGVASVADVDDPAHRLEAFAARVDRSTLSHGRQAVTLSRVRPWASSWSSRTAR